MAKPRKHTPEQIVSTLWQIEVAVASGKTHPAASREAGITEQTYYRWRKENGQLKVGQAKQLKDVSLEDSANLPAPVEHMEGFRVRARLGRKSRHGQTLGEPGGARL